MKQKNKQILFASGTTPSAIPFESLIKDGGEPETKGQTAALNIGGRADVLLNIAAGWMTQERISYAQYDLLRQRLKKTPPVTDIKLYGNVLVLDVEGGTEERIFPEDPNLPQVDIREKVTFYERVWYWIKNHKAVAIGGGSAVLLVVALVIKHARS